MLTQLQKCISIKNLLVYICMLCWVDCSIHPLFGFVISVHSESNSLALWLFWCIGSPIPMHIRLYEQTKLANKLLLARWEHNPEFRGPVPSVFTRAGHLQGNAFLQTCTGCPASHTRAREIRLLGKGFVPCRCMTIRRLGKGSVPCRFMAIRRLGKGSVPCRFIWRSVA